MKENLEYILKLEGYFLKFAENNLYLQIRPSVKQETIQISKDPCENTKRKCEKRKQNPDRETSS